MDFCSIYRGLTPTVIQIKFLQNFKKKENEVRTKLWIQSEYEPATKWLNLNSRGCLLSLPKHSPRTEQQETHSPGGVEY